MTQQLKQDLERGGDIKFIETVPMLTTCIRNIDVVSTFVILNFLFCLIKLSKL